MSKLSLFTTVEKTVRFSQKNTVTSFICFFFSFKFFLFVPPLVAAAALSSNGGRASVCFCSSGPSDDLKGLLQLHDQLPIRFLHLVSEPVLQSVDGRPCDLKQKQRVKVNQKQPFILCSKNSEPTFKFASISSLLLQPFFDSKTKEELK